MRTGRHHSFQLFGVFVNFSALTEATCLKGNDSQKWRRWRSGGASASHTGDPGSITDTAKEKKKPNVQAIE